MLCIRQLNAGYVRGLAVVLAILTCCWFPASVMTLLHDSQHDHFPEQSTPLGRFYLPSSTPRCGCEMACWWIWGCLRQVRPASADRTVHPSILVATLYIVVKCTHHHPSKLVPHPQLKERRCCLSPIYSTLYVVRFCKYIYIYITINPSLI